MAMVWILNGPQRLRWCSWGVVELLRVGTWEELGLVEGLYVIGNMPPKKAVRHPLSSSSFFASQS
jgi:hypothetical protein